MLRSILRLLAVTVVLAHIVVACDGDLNPQPLPPSENSGKDTNAPTTGSSGSGSADSPGGADAGLSVSLDGGADGGDGGDAGDGGAR